MERLVALLTRRDASSHCAVGEPAGTAASETVDALTDPLLLAVPRATPARPPAALALGAVAAPVAAAFGRQTPGGLHLLGRRRWRCGEEGVAKGGRGEKADEDDGIWEDAKA